MGLSSRFPGQKIPMVTESIVSDGMVVIVGAADNACALPGGASPTVSLLGVIYRPDGSSAAVGDTVDVIISGVYPVIAAGSITANNLITSGGSIIKSAERLRELGMVVEDVVVLIDREQGGVGNLADAGIRAHAVFTLSAMLDYLVGSGRLDAAKASEIRTFLSGT